MPVNNISLCFRSTKSASLPLFCWGLWVFFFLSRQDSHSVLALFVKVQLSERESELQASCHFGETSVLSVPSTHTVPVQKGCPSCCPQPLPGGQNHLSLQIQGCSFWAQTLPLGSGSLIPQGSELTSIMQLQSPHAQICFFFPPDDLKISERFCLGFQCSSLT